MARTAVVTLFIFSVVLGWLAYSYVALWYADCIGFGSPLYLHACLCALFATVTTNKVDLRGAPTQTARQRGYQELVRPARLTG